MSDLFTLASAIETELRSPSYDDAATRVCAVCARFLPFDGVAMTLMASDLGRETVYASDEVIGQFERVQYTLGEGPSLFAFTMGRPALVPDLMDRSPAARWPGLVSELARLPMRAVFCFPMQLGAISVGVCSLYRRTDGPLDPDELALVLDSLDLTTLALLELREGSLNESLLERWLSVDGGRRRQVHQATGMLIAQLDLPPEQAFARLRAFAFAEGRDIELVADDIVNRRIRLTPDQK